MVKKKYRNSTKNRYNRRKSKRRIKKRKYIRKQKKTIKRHRRSRHKQRGGLSWPIMPELKNLGVSIPYGVKGFVRNFNMPPPSAPSNPAERNINPQPYKGQYERLPPSKIPDLPDVPNFWETSQVDTNPF